MEVKPELALQCLHVLCAETSFLSIVAVGQQMCGFASCVTSRRACSLAGCMVSTSGLGFRVRRTAQHSLQKQLALAEGGEQARERVGGRARGLLEGRCAASVGLLARVGLQRGAAICSRHSACQTG